MDALKAFQDAVMVRNVTARFKAAAIGYSDEELAILAMIISLKPGYRAKELEKAKLGPYSTENPDIKSLISKGLLKTNRGGAISVVQPKADNVLKEEYVPEKYWHDITNPGFHFKRKEASSAANDLSPNQHYIEKCGTCGTTISQCRCTGNKMVILGTCENCSGKCEGGCSGECDGKCSGECKSRLAMEHSSPEALKEYLHEHPKADPKNHHVEKNDTSNGTSTNKAHAEAVKSEGRSKEIQKAFDSLSSLKKKVENADSSATKKFNSAYDKLYAGGETAAKAAQKLIKQYDSIEGEQQEAAVELLRRALRDWEINRSDHSRAKDEFTSKKFQQATQTNGYAQQLETSIQDVSRAFRGLDSLRG